MNIIASDLQKFSVQYRKHFSIILHHTGIIMQRKNIKKFDLNYLHLTLSQMIEKNQYLKHVERIQIDIIAKTPEERRIYKMLSMLQRNITKYYNTKNTP